MDDPQERFEALGGIVPVVGDRFVPLSGSEIDALEKVLHASLPMFYRRFLETYGATAFGKYVDFSPAQGLPENVSSSGKGHFGFFYGALSQQYDDSFSLEWNIAVYRERMPESIIPIGGDGSGDQICLGISGAQAGKIFYWDHNNEWDEEDYLDDGEPVPPDLKFQNVHLVANSFDDFLLRLEISDADPGNCPDAHSG